MKHVVFFMHGVGKQEKDWSKEHQDKLNARATHLIQKYGLSPKYEVVYHELLYADLLDKNVGKLLEGSKGQGVVYDFLKQGFEQRNDPTYEPATNSEKIAAGLRDYALDVVQYALNAEFMNSVCAELMKQMVEVMLRYPYPENFYSVVSHSLGTKVSFDCLHKLYLGNFKVLPSGQPAPGSPSFKNYYQLASVAQVISSIAGHPYSPNKTHVRVTRLAPQQLGPIAQSYLIYNNVYDPVALIGQSDQINANMYTHCTWIDYLSQIWMHDLACYIDHPEVQLNMIEEFYGVKLDPAVKTQLIADYPKGPHNVSDEVKQAIQEVKQMLSTGVQFGSLVSFITSIKTIIDQLKGA